MSPTKEQYRELEVLVQYSLDGIIDDEQSSRLASLIEGDNELKQYYLSLIQTHIAIMWKVGKNEIDLEAAIKFNDVLEQRNVNNGREPVRPTSELISVGGYMLRKAIASKPAIIGYAAAVVLIAGILAISRFSGSQTTTPDQAPEIVIEDAPLPDAVLPDGPHVAVLTDSVGAQWSTGAYVTGEKLRPGQRLVLTQGYAEITTQRGAKALFEAPATVEIIDHDNALRLISGKLVGTIEDERATGFLVRTPHMDVTDLGTRFGIDAIDPGSTRVEVFEGEVEVKTIIGDSAEPTYHTLTANQAVERLPDGRIVLIEADPNRYVKDLDLDYLRPQLTGSAEWSGLAEGDLSMSERESDTVQVFLERHSHKLTEDAVVDIVDTTPWTKRSVAGQRRVSSGEVVDVYLVHYDRVGDENYWINVVGPANWKDEPKEIEIRFNRRILGVIADETTLRASDTTLGADGVQYPDLRGISQEKNAQRGLDISLIDTATLSEDRKTLRVNTDVVSFLDQVRILVQSDKRGAKE